MEVKDLRVKSAGRHARELTAADSLSRILVSTCPLHSCKRLKHFQRIGWQNNLLLGTEANVQCFYTAYTC